MKVSKRWKKISGIYRLFCPQQDNLDFSNKAELEAYLFESRGLGNLEEKIFVEGKINGYLYGKKMMDITIAMWKEDLPKGLIFLSELYQDKFPHWWLNKIFNRKKAVICFP